MILILVYNQRRFIMQSACPRHGWPSSAKCLCELAVKGHESRPSHGRSQRCIVAMEVEQICRVASATAGTYDVRR
jgi:hypothetical protein